MHVFLGPSLSSISHSTCHLCPKELHALAASSLSWGSCFLLSYNHNALPILLPLISSLKSYQVPRAASKYHLLRSYHVLSTHIIPLHSKKGLNQAQSQVIGSQYRAFPTMWLQGTVGGTWTGHQTGVDCNHGVTIIQWHGSCLTSLCLFPSDKW